MWSNFKGWLAEPFKQPMSALDWFLIVGLVLICAVVWSFVLKHVLETVE